MEALAVPAPRARAIAAAAADWIDSDDQPLPLGAEDAAYRGRGGLTGATMMADVSELRAVVGVVTGDARGDAFWARLRPLLCALPETNLSPINPNTLLPGQAALLAMLLPETVGPPLARLARAERILAGRPAAGWGSVSEFANSALLRDTPLPADVLQQLSVRTSWVMLAFDVTRGETTARGWSLVDARNRTPRIAARRWDGDET
jgi:general secretion pathway protein K